MFCNSPLERLPDTEAVIGKRQRLLADFIQTEALAICVLVITGDQTGNRFWKFRDGFDFGAR